MKHLLAAIPFFASDLTLQPPGLPILDTITGFFQKILNFMVGPYAIFVIAIAGTVAIAMLALKPKEGPMEGLLKWGAVAVGVFAIPSIVVTVRSVF
jgi:hypothetical protein